MILLIMYNFQLAFVNLQEKDAQVINWPQTHEVMEKTGILGNFGPLPSNEIFSVDQCLSNQRLNHNIRQTGKIKTKSSCTRTDEVMNK